jgi:hypothetical protein
VTPPGPGKKASGVSPSPVFASGSGRAATRGSGEVIELDCGVTVDLTHFAGGRWRAVWHEAGERQQCESASEERLAAGLEKVEIRLEAYAPNMRRPGADLIAHYLDPDRLPVQARWSRKHAHIQGRLCALYAAPVIAAVTCQDTKASHMQPARAGGRIGPQPVAHIHAQPDPTVRPGRQRWARPAPGAAG